MPFFRCFSEDSVLSAEAMQEWQRRTSLPDDGPFGQRFFLLGSWVESPNTPVYLTWSIVPDGTLCAREGGPINSSLVSAMDARFGNREVWMSNLQSCFNAISTVCGIRFSRVMRTPEGWDDGELWPHTAGAPAMRGDIRIAGGPIIDNTPGLNTLAYAFGPGGGDLLMDTNEAWNNNVAGNYRFMRNVLTHELGHAAGLDHCCPLAHTKLMEPIYTPDFDSLQLDDILGLQALYGDPQEADNNADNKEGGTGTRAKGEEGSMGNPNTTATGHKYGVQGPQNNPDPHIARQAALREAAEFGMIGLLNAGAGGDPNAPTAPWGREDSLGNDPMSARGNMWGDAIGDSFGAGGLGLSGVGEGGGGRGEGIGLGNIGTIGHGAGTGQGQGFGNGHGRLGGAHQTKSPSVRQGVTQVNGRLPPEVIQRIVRQNFGRFKLCYENGLRTNPNLAGRVAVKFIIDRNGAVSTASDGGSDLPDQGVVSCVVRGFGNLSFPQPEGGIVTVVYPIIFNPGD